MLLKPSIGILLDYGGDDAYSWKPWYALRADYSNAVELLGGIPFFIPYNFSCIESYCNMLDGLILPGGDIDIPPSYYGQEVESTEVNASNERVDFEIALFMQCFKDDKPILGVCAGLQLMNVALGGDLIQHIPDTIGDKVPHKHSGKKDALVHDIQIHSDTKLAKLVKTLNYSVNSCHHQGICKPGEGLIVNATSPEDGLVEGLEHKEKRFCIGVEWHPEYISTEQDKALIKGLVDAAAKKH